MIERLERRWALMLLAAIPGLGPVQIRRLDALLGGRVEDLLVLGDEQLRACCSPAICREIARAHLHFQPDKVAAALERMQADFVTFEEEDYPQAIRDYPDSPIGLYRYRGGSRIRDAALAIVGTRRPSPYGRKVAREWAAGLSACGFQIVSGMAEGIDTEVHTATLQAGGETVAFLGGGLQRCYPASNRALMQQIGASGGVWTEFPIWRSADRRSFPQRNRIVAGVSEAVIVIESGSRGGSLITARMAAEMGRPVYVVPGRIDTPESAGCHALIRDGAQLVTCVDDILADLQALPHSLRCGGRQPAPARPPVLVQPAAVAAAPADPQQALLWNLLLPGNPLHPDTLAQQLALPIARIAQTLLAMELDGAVVRRMDGRYERL